MVAAHPWNGAAGFAFVPPLCFLARGTVKAKEVNSAKFARALVSEIIAIDAVRGMRTSSRIDPLGIRSIPGIIYKTNAEQWTLEAEKAAKMGGKPLLYGKEGSKLGTPPTINHGNILPTTNRTSARCLNGSPFAAC